MALTDGIEVNGVEMTDLIDCSVSISLNNANSGVFSITNRDNGNAACVSPGDIVSFYRNSAKVMEGVAMAPFDYMSSPSTITVNVFGYGGELARKNVYLPHQYGLESGRTLDCNYVIRGGPHQHGDGTFDDNPSDTMSGWSTSDATVTAEATITNKSEGSWKIVTSAANGRISKKLHFDQNKASDYWVSVWVKSASAVTLAVTKTYGLTGSTFASTASTGSGEWERLEIKDPPSGGSMRSILVDIKAASGVTFYVDDFCYAVHLSKDGDNDVWDNGIMANTGYSVSDVSCGVDVDSFETRDNTTIISALRNLRDSAGAASYCWWFGPAAKALHFNAYSTAENTDRARIRGNVFTVTGRKDPSRIVNRVSISTTSNETDWRKIYESSAGDAIQAIWQHDNHIVINVQNASSSKVYATHDAGATWAVTKTFSASTTYAYRLHYDADNNLLMLSTSAEGMFSSSDYGATWSVYDANIQYGNYFQAYDDDNEKWYEFKMGDVSGSGKLYRREVGGTTWSDITPSVAGVTNFYLPQATGRIVVCEGFGGASYPGKIIRTADIMAAVPSWSVVYATPGNHDPSSFANSICGCCKKINNRTGQVELYYSLYNNTPKAEIIRSSDYGEGWVSVFVSSDANDWSSGDMDSNDGIVYCLIRADGYVTSATKYGRIIKSDDDGDTWSSALAGSSSAIYSYALFADRNTIIVARDVPDGGTSRGELIQRTDGYNLVITSEDQDSISKYGEYSIVRYIGDVQTREVGERINQGILDLYAEPIETYSIVQQIDTGIELNKLYFVNVAVKFPLAFTISFASPVELPDEPMSVHSISCRYPKDIMNVGIGRDADDVSRTLADLVERYIEDNATEDVAVCIQGGDDEGYLKTPTGKVLRGRGNVERGKNYILSRIRKNSRGRANAW